MLNRNLTIVFTALFVFFAGVGRPYFNWDMIGYVASAYHADGDQGAELSRKTYGDVRAVVSRQWFGDLTVGPYLQTVYKDPAALEQQLPFYSIRVAYVGLMRALEPLGIGYSTVSYLVSAFFAALSVVVLGAIVATNGLPALALPVIVMAAGFIDLSRLSTPDSLACFFALSAAYCALANRRLLFVISALLPLMRTDAVVLSALLMAHAFWRGERIRAVLSFAFSLAACLLINRWHGNYGWLTLFNFTFFGSSPYPARMALSHSVSDYVVPYWAAFRDLWIEPVAQVPVYALCAYVCFVYRRELRKLPGLHVFFTIPLAFIVSRLTLFPEYEGRFFVFPVSMILVGSFCAMRDALDSRRDVAPAGS